jgi:uncharacterized protein (TIGR03437 family)
VIIDGRPAYLSYVNQGQINLQAPDDATIGSVPVTVTTPFGTASYTVVLNQVAPSFCLIDGKHVAGIILRSDGTGAYGGGEYYIIGPPGSSLGYLTVPAKTGDSIMLFGTGFGPTSPTVAAGVPFSGAAPALDQIELVINSQPVPPQWSGLSGPGLFQFNLTVPPGLGTGDQPIQGLANGVGTPIALLSLQ